MRRSSAAMVRALSRVMVDADATLSVAEAPMHENAEPSDKPKTEAQVVSLDSFRKQ
jgi:hypothetical protein